jgi:signal transduction histidine kinase
MGVLRTPGLIVSMVLAVAGVGLLAFWDGERESASALEDVAQEQATLASAVATDLATRLSSVERDARLLAQEQAAGRSGQSTVAAPYLGLRVHPLGATPELRPDDPALHLWVRLPDGGAIELLTPAQFLVSGLHQSERPNGLRIFIQAPGEEVLRGTDGSRVDAPVLVQALAHEAPTLRVSRPDALKLGLPERTALAGFAHVDTARLGRWGVAVIATAERERDRERRARWRLVLAIGLAGSLVATFGGLALHKQRKELELAKALQLAEVERERDERLLKLSKAATTLTLASGFAHELGTPLGVIVGRAEQLAARVGSDSRSARAAQVILEQAERIQEVMKGFLSLAQGQRLSLQKAWPEQVLNGAVGLVQHRFERAGVHLIKEILPGLPPILCDSRLLEHALVNLLLNACDASAEGASVQVGVETTPQGVSFVVRDEGPGIPPADAARVMQPFFSTKPAGKGTGLGLAIANEIAKSHHGALVIGPGEGHGTRAAIQLPLANGGPHAQA